MNAYQLSRLKDINDNIKYYTDKLEEKRTTLTSGVQQMTGMPHAPGAKDKVGDAMPEIIELQNKIATLKAKRQAIRDFVHKIEDERVRLIFILRVLDRREFKEIAHTVSRTEDAVKKDFYRYLKKL
jgi:DNA-directed RNA polymerase specialized sigma24 family protein